MNLNKLRVMQMIQLALAKKGISCHVDTIFVDDENNEVAVAVFSRGGGNILESFHLSEKTESELLEWHAEIERV